MSRVPNVENAFIDPRKVTEYLLHPTHLKGGPKAGFFGQFGFRRDQPDVLSSALLSHVASCEVYRVVQTIDGVKYEIIGPMASPDGREPFVKAVWIIDVGQTRPRLVTAFPD